MDTLLTNQFLTHYALAKPNASAPAKETNAKYFELSDDAFLIHFVVGDGVAPYKNNSVLQVKVINYETFHIGLPAAFTHGKQICDLLAYTKLVNNYFSLNELTDTDPAYVIDFTNSTGPRKRKRNKAMDQLQNTLSLLMAVPDIKAFIDNFIVKKCCFFNKKATPPTVVPTILTAITSFNRINTITEEGFEMSHPAIEALGFKLFEYSGGKAANIV